MSRRYPFPRLLFVCLLSAGCAASRRAALPQGPSGQPPEAEEKAVESMLQQVRSNKSDYKISPGDLLEINLFQQTDFDRKQRVRRNGAISLPLTGSVKLAGLTVIEAETVLSEKLKEYVVNPQVTIFIAEYGNKKVFVLGEVAKPGSFELPTEAGLTVIEAVSLAGGFTPIAAPDRTKIIRSVGGRNRSIPIEISAVIKRGEKHKDIPLEPDDIVYVPQSFF